MYNILLTISFSFLITCYIFLTLNKSNTISTPVIFKINKINNLKFKTNNNDIGLGSSYSMEVKRD